MLLCFDVGNSQVYGGFYTENKIKNTFRFNTKIGWSSDQLGIFLKSFCEVNSINIGEITGIIISSVVPSLDYHLNNACIKYFGKKPLFIKSGVKTGITVKYRASHEVGADLICGAVGATNIFPDSDLIVVDMGTATTITAVNKEREFISGLIMPGLQTQVSSLATMAEKLFTVEIVEPKSTIAKNTAESIQAGIYYSHLGGMKLTIASMAKDAFGKDNDYKIVATGGLGRVFRNSKLFDVFENNLILLGLVKIFALNCE